MLDRVEEATVGCTDYDWVDNPCPSTYYQITVTAPGGAQVTNPIYVQRSRSDPLPSGGPPWVTDSSYVDPFTGKTITRYSRRITTTFDVSNYTTNGPIQLTVNYQTGDAENWAMGPGISARFALYGASSFKLTQTPNTFRPRDFRDGGKYGEHVGSASPSGPDIAGCETSLGHCRPTFTAFVGGMENSLFSPPPYGAIDFYLSLPAYQTAWLPGNSTNNGADTDPDYVFCGLLDQPQPVQLLAPDRGGLHINMPAPVAVNQVNVCSHDYGGVAILRATVTIAGTPLEAQIIGRNTLMTAVSPPPPSCAGTGQFASLPVDQDCNGIADSWEAPYKNSPGYSANVDLDGGPGQPGDGFSVRDEYRGFHFVTDDWDETTQDPSKIRWTSTDPTKKDVFFWDNDGVFTQALRAILAPTTQPIVYRRVSKAQANPVPEGQPASGVNKLNKNSPTKGTTYGYALDFVNGPGPKPESTGDAQYGASRGQAIYLKNSEFLSASFIDPAVYRAAAVAHEVGHVFGLCHYWDLLVGQVPAPSPLSSLNLRQYALGSEPDPTLGIIAVTYARFNTYLSTVGVISQDVFYGSVYDLAGNVFLQNSTREPPSQEPWPLSRYPAADWVFDGTALGGWASPSVIVQNGWREPISAIKGILVVRQYGYLMDRYLRLYQPPGATDQPNLQSVQNWAWRPPSVQPPFNGDLDLMCGPACHDEAAACTQ